MKLSELSRPIGNKSTSRTDLSLAGLCPSLEYELGRSEQSLSESSSSTKSLIWTPQEGPQILAYYCLADHLYYGGGAGGGKTDLILGLALTAHKRSLILRRLATQLRELMDRSIEIVGTTDGFAENIKLWRRLPGERMVQFAGCEQEADKQNFQGRSHDLKCVARGTPVLMGDGTYKAIELISVGDYVATLEGPKVVERIFPARRKKAVRITSGASSQVQACDHELLTPDGWVSFGKSYESRLAWISLPISRRASYKDGGPYSQTYAPLSYSHVCRDLNSEHTVSRLQSLLSLANRFALETYAYGAQAHRGNDCEASGDGHQETLLLPLLIGHPGQLRLVPSLACELPQEDSAFSRDAICVSKRSALRDYQCHYSEDSHLCDERILEALDRRLSRAAARLYLHRSADAEQPNPIHSREDDRGETHTHKCHKPKYDHPYNSEIRLASEYVSAFPYSSTPAGIVDLFDIQVAEVNHYITGGGFVNKNCFDEITQFLRSQFEFIIGWTRSSIVGQRSRVVATGNPPFDEVGQWVTDYWGAWLNDRHPSPAAPAELRYYILDAEGHEREVPTGDEVDNGKEVVRPKSRTFIPARVEDNIYYMRTGYKDTLASLPEPLRSMMRDGKFNVARAEDPFQVIPSAWIKAAQARWTPKKPDIKLSAVGLDPSRGGKDKTVASKRYANWYAPLNKWPGSAVPDGPAVVALLIPILAVDGERARTAPVNCDVPGIGASAYDWGKAQGYNFQPYNGGSASKMRDKSGVLSFFNKRSADYWLLRELLDPANGEDIELPPDNELYADLAAARFRITPRGVQVEPKDCGKAVAAGASCCIKHRIGRSPDCGDAVVLATAECGTLAFFI